MQPLGRPNTPVGSVTRPRRRFRLGRQRALAAWPGAALPAWLPRPPGRKRTPWLRPSLQPLACGALHQLPRRWPWPQQPPPQPVPLRKALGQQLSQRCLKARQPGPLAAHQHLRYERAASALAAVPLRPLAAACSAPQGRPLYKALTQSALRRQILSRRRQPAPGPPRDAFGQWLPLVLQELAPSRQTTRACRPSPSASTAPLRTRRAAPGLTHCAAHRWLPRQLSLAAPPG
jgi:hypothetical protein